MFCFPNTGHVISVKGTAVSFRFCLIHMYSGCQRLFMRGFLFRSSLKKWPARNASACGRRNEAPRRTQEKPMVPRVIYERTKGQVPLGPLLGKQNLQAKEVYLPTENKAASNINCSTVVLYLMFAALHIQSPLITMSRYAGYSPGNEVEVDTEQ